MAQELSQQQIEGALGVAASSLDYAIGQNNPTEATRIVAEFRKVLQASHPNDLPKYEAALKSFEDSVPPGQSPLATAIKSLRRAKDEIAKAAPTPVAPQAPDKARAEAATIQQRAAQRPIGQHMGLDEASGDIVAAEQLKSENAHLLFGEVAAQYAASGKEPLLKDADGPITGERAQLLLDSGLRSQAIDKANIVAQEAKAIADGNTLQERGKPAAPFWNTRETTNIHNTPDAPLTKAAIAGATALENIVLTANVNRDLIQSQTYKDGMEAGKYLATSFSGGQIEGYTQTPARGAPGYIDQLVRAQGLVGKALDEAVAKAPPAERVKAEAAAALLKRDIAEGVNKEAIAQAQKASIALAAKEAEIATQRQAIEDLKKLPESNDGPGSQAAIDTAQAKLKALEAEQATLKPAAAAAAETQRATATAAAAAVKDAEAAQAALKKHDDAKKVLEEVVQGQQSNTNIDGPIADGQRFVPDEIVKKSQAALEARVAPDDVKKSLQGLSPAQLDAVAKEAAAQRVKIGQEATAAAQAKITAAQTEAKTKQEAAVAAAKTHGDLVEADKAIRTVEDATVKAAKDKAEAAEQAAKAALETAAKGGGSATERQEDRQTAAEAQRTATEARAAATKAEADARASQEARAAKIATEKATADQAETQAKAAADQVKVAEAKDVSLTEPQRKEVAALQQVEAQAQAAIAEAKAKAAAATKAPAPETGTAGPKPETGTAGPKPETGTAGPKPETGTTGPKPETGTAGPKPETGTAGPKPETGTAGPKPETGTAGPKPETGTAGPKPETGTAGPKPETGTADPKPDTGADAALKAREDAVAKREVDVAAKEAALKAREDAVAKREADAKAQLAKAGGRQVFSDGTQKGLNEVRTSLLDQSDGKSDNDDQTRGVKPTERISNAAVKKIAEDVKKAIEAETADGKPLTEEGAKRIIAVYDKGIADARAKGAIAPKGTALKRDPKVTTDIARGAVNETNSVLDQARAAAEGAKAAGTTIADAGERPAPDGAAVPDATLDGGAKKPAGRTTT